VFNLADDEALIIELKPLPDGVYWSLQAGDVWSRSLNFTHRHTSVNMRHAKVDQDGFSRRRRAQDRVADYASALCVSQYRATGAPCRYAKVKLPRCCPCCEARQ